MADIILAQGDSLPGTMQARYRDMADGTHALVIWTGETAANLQINNLPVNETNPVPVEEVIRTAGAWPTLVNAVVFDAVTTAFNSIALDISGEGAIWVLIFVQSVGAPTNIRVLPQFSSDASVTWWDFEEGLWASLMWEDTDTAAGIHKAYLLPCGGQDLLRFNVVATGTGVGATFTVTIHARAFHGNFGVAHA